MKPKEYKNMYEFENFHFWFVAKRHFIQKYIDMITIKPKTCLDIGSGTGGLTKYLSKSFNVIGIEKNNYALSFAKKRKINILNGDSQNLLFPDNTFDLVTIFDVLYHKNIKSISRVFQESHRVLKKNGHILITDSAFNFLTSKHDLILGGTRRFTIKQIKKEVQKAGFKTIKSTYTYFSIFPIVYLKKRLLNNKFSDNNSSDLFKVNSIINSFIILILKFESYLLNFISFPIGSSLMVLAKKI